MSILNVDKIQPIGGGSTITVDATDIQASTGTIRASTFSGDISATGIGVTSLNVAGVSTFAGAIDANGDLDVDGHTNLDNGNVSGVVTFSNSPSAIDMNDNSRISFGTSLKTSIYYNSSESKTYIRNWTDTLHIGYRNTEIYHTNQARLTFDSGNTFSNVANTNFTGANYSALWVPASNMFRLNDNAKLAFGSQGDTQMYHNNSHFYLQNTTGNVVIDNSNGVDMYLNSGNDIYIRPQGTENGIKVIGDGSVELYHDNQLKLSTGNNGINVSGSVSIVDGGRYYFGSANDAYLFHDGANTHFYNQTGHLQIRQAANADVVIQTNAIDRFRIHEDGVVAIGQSSKSSTVGAGNLDIQGNATSCILEMGNPFPTYSGGVVPEFRITATNSSHTVDFESVWGGDNALHKHLALAGGATIFYRGDTGGEVARFNNVNFGIGTQSPGDKLHVNGGDIIISNTNAPNLRIVNADDSTGSNSNRAFFGIASGSNNYMNGTADNDLCIVGPDGGRMMIGYGNSVKFRMNSDGTIFSAATYNNTTSSSSRSVVMPNNTGEFFASTSSRKFKTNITTLTDALADKILECRPVSFNSTCDVDNKSKIFYGLIAEEVHEIDTSLVAYEDENAETPIPTSVQYDRFVPHLINLVKRQKAQIATLEAKVSALEGS